MQQKQKCVTPQTSTKYLIDALAFCSFYFSLKYTLIYTAEEFMVLLVWQHTMHTLPYFCKQVLVTSYV
jgi:hypothetical protein